jgi:Putative beta-lactamase-inhibitor-like, PepSY-like
MIPPECGEPAPAESDSGRRMIYSKGEQESTMRKFLGRLTAVAAMVVLTGTMLRAEEEKVALDKLPAAVVKAIKAKYPKAELVAAEAGEEDGKKQFEVDIKNGEHELELTLSPGGKILVVERVIAAKDLPKVVEDALEAKYPKAKIEKVEEVSKDDKVASYDITVVTADKKKVEAEFDVKGKFIDEEKPEKSEEKKEEKKVEKKEKK